MIQGLQALRISVCLSQKVPQSMDAVVYLLNTGAYGVQRLCQRGFQMRQTLQGLPGQEQVSTGATVFIIQCPAGQLRSVQQVLKIGQPLVFGVELLPLARQRGEFVHFADLP